MVVTVSRRSQASSNRREALQNAPAGNFQILKAPQRAPANCSHLPFDQRMGSGCPRHRRLLLRPRRGITGVRRPPGPGGTRGLRLLSTSIRPAASGLSTDLGGTSRLHRDEAVTKQPGQGPPSACAHQGGSGEPPGSAMAPHASSGNRASRVRPAAQDTWWSPAARARPQRCDQSGLERSRKPV